MYEFMDFKRINKEVLRNWYQKRLDEEALRNSRLKEMHDILQTLKQLKEEEDLRDLICPQDTQEKQDLIGSRAKME
jgi:hypothetical protein